MPESENGIYEAVKEWRLYHKSRKLIALKTSCQDDYELDILNQKIDEAIQLLERENEVSI